MAPIGLLVVYVAVVSGSMVVSMICVRYRDVPPVMTSLLQLLFFISPIIWVPENIKGGELFVESESGRLSAGDHPRSDHGGLHRT